MVHRRCLELLHKAKTARQLRPSEQMLVIDAWFTLLFIRFRLRFLPYASWRPELVRAITRDPHAEADPYRESLSQMVKLFGIAVRNQWVPPSCLRRSLALHRFLTRRDIPARVVIGIKRVSRRLAGHAWVEVTGCVVNDHRDVRNQFQVLEPGRLNSAILDLLDSRF